MPAKKATSAAAKEQESNDSVDGERQKSAAETKDTRGSNPRGQSKAKPAGEDPAYKKLQEARDKLKAVLDEVSAKTDEIEESMKKHLGEVEFSLADEIARTESKIRENPLLSVGIAAAAGLVIGLLLNRNQ